MLIEILTKCRIGVKYECLEAKTGCYENFSDIVEHWIVIGYYSWLCWFEYKLYYNETTNELRYVFN